MVYTKDQASLDGHGSFTFEVKYLIAKVNSHFALTKLYLLCTVC